MTGAILDANFILNGCTLALVIWIAASVTGLRERVSRIEGFLQQRTKGQANEAKY